jgi:hypothetical protein
MSDLARHGQLILQLYQLRTEAELRKARAWFVTAFAPAGPEAIVALLASGQAESAKYRMVTTYWEMAAALVNRGALDRELFLAANSEHLAVFALLEPHLHGLRTLIREPGYLRELETLVLGIDGIRPMLEARRRLFSRWAQAAASPG